MRRLSLVFLAILIAGIILFGGAMHLVHGIQVRRNASTLLEDARRAEANKDPVKVEQTLRWYLSLRPDDGEAWAWYARVVDREDNQRRRIERSFLVHEQALQRAPGDRR